jgi:hypothetical protein
MAEWCKRFFEIMADWKNIIYITKTKIIQESKTSYIEEWWIVQNGPIQQNVKMFDNYKSIDGDLEIYEGPSRGHFTI